MLCPLGITLPIVALRADDCVETKMTLGVNALCSRISVMQASEVFYNDHAGHAGMLKRDAFIESADPLVREATCENAPSSMRDVSPI